MSQKNPPANAGTFAEWLAKVDKHVVDRLGICLDDLPDWNYRDAYDEGMTPARAASRTINNAKRNL